MPVCYAAYGGHLPVLKWALANDCQVNGEEVAMAAARCGHLDVLNFVQRMGGSILHFTHRACSIAAEQGGAILGESVQPFARNQSSRYTRPLAAAPEVVCSSQR